MLAFAGTSAFGMSGVNAHVVFAAVSHARSTTEEDALLFQRFRYWAVPPVNPLIRWAHGPNGAYTFIINLGCTNTAYLADHQVSPPQGTAPHSD